jgi:hypothetical protein
VRRGIPGENRADIDDPGPAWRGGRDPGAPRGIGEHRNRCGVLQDTTNPLVRKLGVEAGVGGSGPQDRQLRRMDQAGIPGQENRDHALAGDA